jgi:Arc/MetJ-type ribon-helix-helix transcriptional regulator
MNLVLDVELAQWVRKRVADGEFGSLREARNAGPRLLSEQEEMRKLSAIRIEEADRGRFL